MRRNLEMTRGLVFSGQLLLDLAAAGMLREDAYAAVQKHAMHAFENETDFRTAIENDPEIGRMLTREQLAETFLSIGNCGMSTGFSNGCGQIADPAFDWLMAHGQPVCQDRRQSSLPDFGLRAFYVVRHAMVNQILILRVV